MNVLGGLKELLKQHHHKIAYEAYDMDKYMPVAACGTMKPRSVLPAYRSGGREATARMEVADIRNEKGR